MQAPSYSTAMNTLATLFLILLGEFDYAEMNSVSRLWAIIVSNTPFDRFCLYHALPQSHHTEQ